MVCIVVVLAASILAIAIESSATAATDDYHRAAQLEKQGQFFRAAETYSRMLRLKPGDKKARTALVRIADQAIAEKLSSASKLEAELKLDQAIAEIEAAGWLQERLTSLKIEVSQPHAVGTRRDHLIDRRLQALLLEAERARADGLWSAAVAHLQQVETLKPGYLDTRQRLIEVWVAWGEANVREGRLRAAAERFEQAALVPVAGQAAAASRAAAIRAALGMSELARGACRAAAADLRAAERLAPGSVEAGALERAAGCAKTCVQIKVTADPDSGVDEGQQALLGAEVRRQVAAGASEYLLFGDSGAGSKRGCDRRTVPGFDGQPLNVGPYSVAVRVTAISAIRQPASSFTRQVRSQRGMSVDTVVTYEEYVEVLTGTMSGWVVVTSQGAGNEGVPLPVKVAAETLARWQRSPVSTTTTRDEWTGRGATGVMVDVSGRGKAHRGRRTRSSGSDGVAWWAVKL